jgi:glycolate oxidase FAD binding subunit
MDLNGFAAAVGADGPVTVSGLGTRGGPVPNVRVVGAPAGITWVAPEEMTVACGAATPVAELDAALAADGQRVSLPVSGTVGGALAVGLGTIRRLGDGPVRDALLQARVVTADGVVAKAGGPTVKNVSGFDLCRLLVGSHGTLAFVGDVILRTRPRPAVSRWFAGAADPFEVRRRLYRPTSILWDGVTTWVCLEGHPADVDAEAVAAGLPEVDGPPPIPSAGRASRPAADLAGLAGLAGLTGRFVAEVGVGVVHLDAPVPAPPADPVVVALHERLKTAFDPTGRLNPGRSALPGTVAAP